MFDKILVSVGRSPNSKVLNLSTTDIQLDDNGFIKVDEYQKTSVKNIFAIGDIVADIVDLGRHGMHPDQTRWRRHEKVLERLEVAVVAIKPGVPGIRRQHHRHAVVHALGQAIGGGSDDGESMQRLGLRLAKLEARQLRLRDHCLW